MTTCPACGGDSATHLYTVGSDVAARTFAPRVAPPEQLEVQRSIEAIWGRSSCDFVRCRACTFAYADPFVAATPEFYAKLYSTTDAYSETKWEFERTIAALKESVHGGRLRSFSLLDVGAGAGAFAARVSGAFKRTGTVLCTEYSGSGREVIRARGIACVPGSLMDLDAEQHANCFDVLCLFQVLEHMVDLDAVFDRLSTLAAPVAHLFVAVPNDRQRSYYDALGFHEDLPPVHVGRWNRHSLEIVAKRHGWRIEEDAVEPEAYASKVRRLAWQFYTWDSGVRRLGRVRLRHVRRALRAALISLFLLRSVRVLVDLRSGSIGTTYWAHLSRE